MRFADEEAYYPPGHAEQSAEKLTFGALSTKDAKDTKDTNPKDAAGSARIDLSLVSDLAIAEEALAMEEGATKYGAYNYRIAGVKSRVYVAAMRRHLAKWLNGEDRDPKTGVHHLGSVRACAGILLDAEALGKLVDDRPPSNRRMSQLLDAFEARVRKVREVFKDFSPKHYTIRDTEHVAGTRNQIHQENPQQTGQEDPHGENPQRLPGRDS